jgi:hypothetical protein
VTKQQREPRATAGLGITQHREIAIGIAESEQRPAADMQADVQRLRLAIVEARVTPGLDFRNSRVIYECAEARTNSCLLLE